MPVQEETWSAIVRSRLGWDASACPLALRWFWHKRAGSHIPTSWDREVLPLAVWARTKSSNLRSNFSSSAQHLSRFAHMRSSPPFTPRYAVQFNAARVDSLPVEAHDRGWAVYPSDLYLPVNFSFGAERCWTCGNQGGSVRSRVGLKGLEYVYCTWFHHVGFRRSRFGCSTELSLFGKVSILRKRSMRTLLFEALVAAKLFGQVLVTEERDHQQQTAQVS